MLKLLCFLIASSVLVSNPVPESIEGKEFDDTQVITGAVGARYIPVEDKRIKTRVQLAEGKYDYDLFGRNDFEYFPLQLGNGNYKVSIFENIQDTKYRVVKTQDVKAELKNPLSVYLTSIQTINWNKDMAVIKKAAELTKGLKTDNEKINAIYNYVIKSISYDYEKIKKIDSTYVPNIDQIIKDTKGICYDYAAVFAAMLRSQNIPAKLIKGYSTNVKEYHAWNEIYLVGEKRWMIVDTTYDAVMYRNKKTYKKEKEVAKYKTSKEY